LPHRIDYDNKEYVNRLHIFFFVSMHAIPFLSMGASDPVAKVREGRNLFVQINRTNAVARVEHVKKVADSLTWSEIHDLVEAPDRLAEEEQEFFSNDLLIFTKYMPDVIRAYKSDQRAWQRIILYQAIARSPGGASFLQENVRFASFKTLVKEPDPVWAARAAILRAWLFPRQEDGNYLEDCRARLERIANSSYRKLC
jgi:hypothetical protein